MQANGMWKLGFVLGRGGFNHGKLLTLLISKKISVSVSVCAPRTMEITIVTTAPGNRWRCCIHRCGKQSVPAPVQRSLGVSVQPNSAADGGRKGEGASEIERARVGDKREIAIRAAGGNRYRYVRRICVNRPVALLLNRFAPEQNMHQFAPRQHSQGGGATCSLGKIGPVSAPSTA